LGFLVETCFSCEVFENRVLRRIFGPKGDEVTGGWRELHNEELRDLYSSPSLIRITKVSRMKWAGHVARMVRNRLLVGKMEGNIPLGRRRWEDNIISEKWYSTLWTASVWLRMRIIEAPLGVLS
jgi:hypothetical protein